MSIVESLLYVEALKNQFVLAELQTNQAGWLFVAQVSHGYLSVRVFPQGCLATSAHDEVAVHNMYQP